LKKSDIFTRGGKVMQIDGHWQGPVPRHCAAGPALPLLARFTGKFVLDILPAALASVIGGFLFTQYQAGRAAPPAPPAQMSPASAEVLALVRDEHEAIIGYVKSQIAAEKSRLAAQDAETAQALADAKAAQNEARENALAEQNAADIRATAAPARRMASAVSAKVTVPRAKPAVAPNPTPEPVTAQAEQNSQQSTAAAPADRVARDPDSLLAKTLDLKDHVVAATKQAVAALGDMFASVGERIGGSPSSPRPFSSDS
jgi:hypothetical protein